MESISCDANLLVIVKLTSLKPVCVKQETSTKLIERGWGISIESFKSILDHALTLTTDKKLYKIGEIVKITTTNTSDRSLRLGGVNIVNSEKNTEVCCMSIGPAVIPPPFLPHTSRVWIWNQNNSTGGDSQVIAGNYTIGESYIFENSYEGMIKKTVSVEIK